MSIAPITDIAPAELLGRAAALKAAGWRFVQCCASRNGDAAFELLYTFSDDATSSLANLRIDLPVGTPVSSVGDLFPCAFMFENEMHDLFGIEVSGITLDYRGGFYHLHIPTPMAKAPERAAKKAAPTAGQEA